ncbi:MAG: hypothetical protein ABW133_25905 [Polyangiaceae bacterium]
MMKEESSRTRGLVAVEESRASRKSGRIPAIPPRFILWTVTVVIAFSIYYWRKTQAEIESQKAALFAKQRGIVSELGAKFDPLRERIEDWTTKEAGAYAGDVALPELGKWDFATQPGIYLRLRLSDATQASSIRKAAQASLRDAFTACLFREPNADPTSGPACKLSHDCSPGTFCNELDHCMPPAQPYNMRAAYHGTKVLGEDWTVRLRTAGDDMTMRLLEREFDSAVKDDIPLVIDLMTRAQFFLLVLDEESTDAPAGEKPPIDVLHASPHPARVTLFGLKPGMDRVLLRARRNIDGRFVPAGEAAITDPGLVAAQQRQVNSCQLALYVREVLGTLPK